MSKNEQPERDVEPVFVELVVGQVPHLVEENVLVPVQKHPRGHHQEQQNQFVVLAQSEVLHHQFQVCRLFPLLSPPTTEVSFFSSSKFFLTTSILTTFFWVLMVSLEAFSDLTWSLPWLDSSLFS